MQQAKVIEELKSLVCQELHHRAASYKQVFDVAKALIKEGELTKAANTGKDSIREFSRFELDVISLIQKLESE